MTTVRDLIRDAALNIGIVAAGEPMEAAQAEDALRALNRMVQNWSLERLMIYAVTPISYALNGSRSVTIGMGGNINTSRPVSIESVFGDGAQLDYKRSSDDGCVYADIVDDDGYPQRTLTINDGVSVNQLLINAVQQIVRFSSLDDEVVLPDGYETALVYNLAVQLAPQYGRDAGQTVISLASDVKADLKRINEVVPELRMDESILMSRGSSCRAW